MSKTSDRIIVVLVWLLIIFIAASFILLFLSKLYLVNKIWFFIVTIPLAITLPLLAISYALSICVSPGQPSADLNQQYEAQLEQIKKEAAMRQVRKKQRRKKSKSRHYTQQQRERDLQETVNELKQIDYCFKCQNIKPLRAHHCSVCNKCVLRMDHHCPYVGNCVGLQNHKYFMLFLLYATLGLLIVTISIAVDLFTGQHVLSKLDEQIRYIMYFVGFISLALALSIGFLLFTQTAASMENLTTLDTFIQDIQDKNPWDTHSIYDNLAQIFGKGCWLFPSKPKLQQAEHQNYHKIQY